MGLWTVLLLLVTVIGSVSCLQNVSGNEGESVTFTAKLNLPAQNERGVTWRFGVSPIASAALSNPPTYNNSCTDRCTLYGNTNLQLDNLTPRDEGQYTLLVTNIGTGEQQTEPFHLTVYSMLSSPTLKYENESTTYDKAYPVNGTNVSLHCDTGGQNVVTYTFLRDGVTACTQSHVTCNKDFLYFQPITMSDTGIYTCKIENPISRNTSQPLSLIVTARVSNVRLISNETSGLISVGKDSVNLTCSALGTNVTFSWYLDGAPLPPDSRYKLMNSNSSLIISPVEMTDSGFFTCIGSNSLNNETSNNLTIAWSPDPIQCNASESTNQRVTLFCSWPGGNPTADVTLEFQNNTQTLKNSVNRTVPKASVTLNNNILSCNGTQNGHLASCELPVAVPAGKQTNNDSTVTEGKPATMSVNLISNFARAVSQSLPATFTWKNPQNRTIFNGSNYTINSNDFWSELVIHKVTVSDNGTFKCEAENFMGISTFFFQLRIQQEPVPGSNPPLSPGAIAGIVIGALAGVALIATAVFFIVKSTKKKSNKDSSRNPEMNLTGVADKNKEDEEYVKYADLRFKNTNPANNAASQQVPETEYSTVKR